MYRRLSLSQVERGGGEYISSASGEQGYIFIFIYMYITVSKEIIKEDYELLTSILENNNKCEFSHEFYGFYLNKRTQFINKIS